MGRKVRAASLAAVVAIALVACGPTTGFGVVIGRDGSRIHLTMPGRNEANTQGWLCPEDPGPGEVWGQKGATRLRAAGCLDLGFTATNPNGAPDWEGTVDLSTLSDDQLAPFAGKSSFRFIVVSGANGGVHEASVEVPSVDMTP